MLEAGTSQHHLLSSSVGSMQGYKEPIRSFIHASVRDQLGNFLAPFPSHAMRR